MREGRQQLCGAQVMGAMGSRTHDVLQGPGSLTLPHRGLIVKGFLEERHFSLHSMTWLQNHSHPSSGMAASRSDSLNRQGHACPGQLPVLHGPEA